MDTDTQKTRDVHVENTAEAFLEGFDVNGVEYFFSSPGSEYAPFWECFGGDESPTAPPEWDDSIRYVNCRHEELAVQMAMGYTFRTGDPQVVALHTNVGTLHAAMSIYGAYQSEIPMFLVASHADTHEKGTFGGAPGPHYLDFDTPGGHENNFSRYLKWSAHPETSAIAEKAIARGFRIARSTPTGPVMVNLSREVIWEAGERDVTVRREAPATPPSPDPSVLDTVARKLDAADEPLILTGQAGKRPETVEHLVSLAEKLSVPVLEGRKWYTSFPSDHPLYLGAELSPDHYTTHGVDLLFVVDSKAPWYPPHAAAPDAEVILLAPDPTYVKKPSWNYPVDLLVTGEPAVVLPELVRRVGPTRRPDGLDWKRAHEKLHDHWAARADAGREKQPIDPFWLCDCLDRLVPDDAILINETLVHRFVIANLVGTKDRDYLDAVRVLSNGLGGGLGMALGAKLADPDRPVVALVGDGSYDYNPVNAAFAAAQQYSIPTLTVIFNNQGYQSQTVSQQKNFPEGHAANTGRSVGSPPQEFGYATQAQGWDAYGEMVTDPDDVEEAIQSGLEATENGRAALLDVILEEEPPDRTPPENAP